MLVGRDTERAAIEALLDAARASRSGTLLVHGAPGIGKTALLEDARARAADMQVLSARGVESESDLAFAALHQLLRPALHLVDALPAPQAAALRGALGLSEQAGVDRFLVSVACLTLLSELAEQGPLLCLVDDIQWVDGPSVDALLFVARRLDAEGVVLLCGARDGEWSLDVRDLPTLELRPLDESDAAALLTASAGALLPASVRDALLAQAAGNALALSELPTALSAAQLSGGEPLPAALPLTRALSDLYSARVAQLPEATQQVLLVAAADETGRLAPIVSAADLLGVTVDALDAAEAVGLVRVSGPRIEFRHPLVRSSVYSGATPTARRSVHAALAAASTEAADADRRAWHLAAAATGPDAEIAAGLEATAGRARARSGYSAAAAALVRASELSVDSAATARRLVGAAAAAWHAGQPDRALALLDAAAPDIDDAQVRVVSEHIRGAVQFWCGHLPDACATLMAAADGAAPLDPRRTAEILCDAAGAAAWTGDFALITEASARAATLPSDGDDEYVFLVDLLRSLNAVRGGSTADLRATVGSVADRAAGFSEPRWLVWAAAGARVAGDDARATTLVRHATDLARRSGAVDALTLALAGEAIRRLLDGRLGSEVDALEGLALAQEAGLVNGASVQLAALTWLAALKGDADACERRFEEAEHGARTNGVVVALAIAHWGRALLDLGCGRFDEAATRLETLATEPALEHPQIRLASAADLVEALVATGRTDRARAVSDALVGVEARGGAPWASGLVARCRALCAGDDDAEHEYAAALEANRSSARTFDRARTALAYGEWLRRNRRRVDAREQLRVAAGIFEQLGALPWVERTHGELRASGETARKRDPSAVDALTPQELRIARLVADGLTNREVAAQLFLSPRTIHYHLRHIFVKLDITSRTQLARLPLGNEEAASARPVPS